MFAFINKKIGSEEGVLLKCIAWNAATDLLARGGQNGFLQILRLTKHEPTGNIVLSTNQLLHGHAAACVNVVCWNEKDDKLTSADESGTIIVWTRSNSKWTEEMRNETKEEKVSDMRWDASWEKICILYENGRVLVGNVEGKQYWKKHLGFPGHCVVWSPDSRMILISNENDICHAIDSHGDPVSKFSFPPQGLPKDAALEIAAFDWFARKRSCNAFSLAVGYRNGVLLLMRHESDEQPRVLLTEMSAMVSLRWNHSGMFLFACGRIPVDNTAATIEDNAHQIQIYSHLGEKLTQFSVPGRIHDVTWSANDLELGICADSFLYVASIRYALKWTHFCNTLVYVHTNPLSFTDTVFFLDISTHDLHSLQLEEVTFVTSTKDMCILVSKEAATGECSIRSFSSRGDPLCSIPLACSPHCIVATADMALIASNEGIHIWHCATPQIIHNHTSQNMTCFTMNAETGEAQVLSQPSKLTNSARRFLSLSASGSFVAASRERGDVLLYHVNDMKLRWRCAFDLVVTQVALNSDASRLALIDSQNVLQVVAINRHSYCAPAVVVAKTPTIIFSTSSVWNVLWSTDDPRSLVFMDRARLYILHDAQVEEPLGVSGRPCRFANLEIDCLALDWLVPCVDIGAFDAARIVYTFDTKSLRDVKKLLGDRKLQEAFERIQAHPHRRLWTMAAETALRHGEFALAERAFTECSDYCGVQFVKKLHSTRTPSLQQAMIAYYDQRFDEAERIYAESSRPDLAIELRLKLGDLSAAETLMKKHGCEDEDTKKRLWDSLGDCCAERGQWKEAARYFMQSRNSARLIDPLFYACDVRGLAKLTKDLPEGSGLLLEVGERQERLGMCAEAVLAFRKGGDLNRAVQCCLRLNDWGLATEICNTGHLCQIESSLQQQVNRLLASEQPMAAVRLYSSTCRHLEASRLLENIAKKLNSKRTNLAVLKKVHVLRALELSRHKHKLMKQSLDHLPVDDVDKRSFLPGSANQSATQILEELVTPGGAASQAGEDDPENAWRMAEAYHFLALTNRMMFEEKFENAMRCALHLQRFVDVICPEVIYSLLALSSFRCHFLKQTSRAFAQLENSPAIPEERKQAYKSLAMRIFSQITPHDPRVTRETKEYDAWHRHLFREGQPPTASVCVRTAKCIRGNSNSGRQCACCRRWCLSDRTPDLRCPFCRGNSEVVRAPKTTV